MTKIGNPEYRKDLVYEIRILLAGIEIGHHIGIVRDINVGFMGPVEDFSRTPIYGFPDGNAYVDNQFPVVPAYLRSDTREDRGCSRP